MKPDQFRHLALAMPGAVEGSHQRHADFRAGNKIFASLGYPDAKWGMVKLTPDQQEMLTATEPLVFKPAKGTWRARGSTQVFLDAVNEPTAASAIMMAWANITS